MTLKGILNWETAKIRLPQYVSFLGGGVKSPNFGATRILSQYWKATIERISDEANFNVWILSSDSKIRIA